MLFLVQYFRPDISTTVRELSKSNNKANYAHYKRILRVVNYILKTRNRMLQFIPTSGKDNWEFKCMCDSDNTGDKDNHVSVTGHCIYINGCLISWKSRAQKYYSLSSTEAEYVVLSGISCKILFIKMILEFLGEIIEYLISVYSDNVGASYLV